MRSSYFSSLSLLTHSVNPSASILLLKPLLNGTLTSLQTHESPKPFSLRLQIRTVIPPHSDRVRITPKPRPPLMIKRGQFIQLLFRQQPVIQDASRKPWMCLSRGHRD